MQILRITLSFHVTSARHYFAAKDSAMPRTSLVSASLLTLAIALAGCGKEPAAPQANVAASAATSSQVEQSAGQAVVGHYADLALAVFGDALSTGKALQQAIDTLLATPNPQTLQAARDAWIAARPAYLQSEVFRFGNSVVDDLEGQLNAWPLDEGLIDYVSADYQGALGNPGSNANIIANPQIQLGEDKVDASKITPELLASLNELGGSEANVATGYHAIEFLLWGQDLNGNNPGAGNRPATDYAQDASCTGGNCDRRADYLKAVTALLVRDLETMVSHWQPNVATNYRASLLAEPAENGLRKMFFGMGSLSLGELAGERMKVALEANSSEDEQDCFSDNTHNSHFYDGKGIRNVYLGEYRKVDGSTLTGPSLSALVAKADAQTDRTLQDNLKSTEAKLQALVDSANNGQHFDQLIGANNTAGQQLVRDAIAALVTQTAAIEQAAAKLGISELKPETADHQF
jgi:putative iron-regulated protein